MTESHLAGTRVGETLSIMQDIHARALRLDPVETTAPLRSVLPTSGTGAAPFVHEARVNLSQQNTVGPTRLRFLKRWVLRMSELFTHRLAASSAALASGVERLDAELAQVRAELAATRADMAVRVEQGVVPQLVSVELQVNEALDALARDVKQVGDSIGSALEVQRAAQELRADELDNAVGGLGQRVDRLDQRVGEDRIELHRVRASLAQVTRRVNPGTADPEAPRVEPLSTVEQQTYVDFELRFRGSRDEVMALQRDALPFVADLAGSPYPLLDLGCGRGEWLELLGGLGIRAYGVDSNGEMIAEVQSRGLEGVLGDAIEHLEALAPSSVQAVTGFHLAEHLSLSDLGRLVDAALVALRPGGLLLLETPNPTNLTVGAASFYLDPTHVRPLHPLFLSFLLESRGFSDVETLFVHPGSEAVTAPQGDGGASELDRLITAVNWALFGPQDYLVAARRHPVST